MIETQYSPQAELDERLRAIGVSKTVYALVTPWTEEAVADVVGSNGSDAREIYLDMFREAWTRKQDRFHEDFFDAWHSWSRPVVDIDPRRWCYRYPTAGASEGLRHLIYDHAARTLRMGTIHVFQGEYEGFRAMAEAAGLRVVEHQRDDENVSKVVASVGPNDIFVISQPSAIDGNVWRGFNDFIETMPDDSVLVDLTYVGAVPRSAIQDTFRLNAPSIRNIVFSLSKPFGAYYHRIGGVYARKEDAGLFGNRWFKNLTSLALGTRLIQSTHVFEIAEHLAAFQADAVLRAGAALGVQLEPSDVSILATGNPTSDGKMESYLTRAGRMRVCLTPLMSEALRSGGMEP